MNKEFKYVFQFRGPVRSELCSILDLNDKWRELAAWLGYSVRDVEQIIRIAGNRSPSDVLLEQWGQKAPTMHKLFIALSEIQHYQALMLLKDFVPEELHALIYEGEENLDDEVGAEIECDSECFFSSDTNNIVVQNDGVAKQLNSKLIDINRAISSRAGKQGISQPLGAYTSDNEVCYTGHQSTRFNLVDQQQDQAFPPNVVGHKTHVKDMFHRITEQEGAASAATVNTHMISGPPACFVPPEVLNSPAFNGYVPLSPPWFNSDPHSSGILTQDECPRMNPSVQNPNGLEKNETLQDSTFSIAGIPSSSINTSQNASRPARRVLGSSLVSKKLMLEAS